MSDSFAAFVLPILVVVAILAVAMFRMGMLYARCPDPPPEPPR